MYKYSQNIYQTIYIVSSQKNIAILKNLLQILIDVCSFVLVTGLTHEVRKIRI